MKSTLRIAFVLSLTMFFNSCRVTTEPVTSELEVPKAYTNNRNDTTNIGLLPWTVFHKDSSLLEYISAALKTNLDLKAADQTAKLSRAEWMAVKRNFLPMVGAEIGGDITKFGEYTMDGVGNDDTNKSETLPNDKRLPSPYREFFGGLTFGWELDIWGKLSSQRKAALARYMASREFKHGVTTWLVGEVASNYYELIGLDYEKQVLEQNLELQQLELEMIRIQKLGGNVNQLAVDQFEAQLLNTKEQLIGVEQSIIQAEARLNELLGRFPTTLPRTSIDNIDVITAASTGHPETLLKHRPDIRQAELELAATSADVDAAKAAFYPSLTILGGVGVSSFDASKLLSPGSVVHNLAAGVSAPIFHQKRIRALYEGATARQRLALVNYEKAVLSSFHEVYTTINAFENLQKQIDLKQQEAEVVNRAFQNSNELFKVGYATYLDVITVQKRLLEVERELARLKKEKLKMRALLYRALGGGWQAGTDE